MDEDHIRKGDTMNIGERWKKSLLNNWMVFEKEDVKHYFYPVKMKDAIDWGGKLIASGNYYNLYYANEIGGSLWKFSYWERASANIKFWARCSPLKDKRALKKLTKNMTQSLLRGEEKEIVKDAVGYIERILGDDEDRI